METRSWPPLGRSHCPRVGKLFGGKLIDRNVFYFQESGWKKKEKKLIDENLFNLNEMCSLQKKVE